jgi:hypothetical protein
MHGWTELALGLDGNRELGESTLATWQVRWVVIAELCSTAADAISEY